MGPPVPSHGGWVEEQLRNQRELNERRQREHDETVADFHRECGDIIDIPPEDVIDITDQRRITHEPGEP